MDKHARMRASLREAAAHVPPPDPSYLTQSVVGKRIQVAAQRRPETISLRMGTEGVDPAIVEGTFTSMLTANGGARAYAVPYLRCGFRKERGNKLFAQGKYSEAIEMYLSGMRAILGEGFELPAKEYLNEVYTSVLGGSTEKFKEVLDLTACAGNIAQCYIKMNKTVEVSVTSFAFHIRR